MATKKKTAGKTATEETIGDRVSRLEKIAAYLTRAIAKFGTKSFADVERELGLDIDKDGKVGSAYIRTLLVCAICGLVALSVFAAENVVIRWIAGEGDDAVVRIEADQGDDAADELDIIMGADGEAAISLAGTEVLTLDASGNLAVTGTLTSGPVTATTIYGSGAMTVSNSVTFGSATIQYYTTFNGGHIDVPTALGAVTNTQVLSALNTFETVAPGGTVTNSLAAPTAAGRVYTVINIAAQNWILSDAGTVKLAGEATLNQYDSITLRAIDTNSWVEVSRSNN